MPPHPARQWLLMLARWAFLLMLPVVVFVYGGTQSSSQSWLQWGLLGVTAAYAAGCALAGYKPRLGKVLPVLIAVLMMLGWLAACNPGSAYDESLRLFIPLSFKSWWPWGTVDADASVDTMRRITGILAGLLMARDLAAEPRRRRAAPAVIAWSGIGVAVFGLAQKLSGDIGNYWGTAGTRLFRGTVFGPFWYHANAGAFLNLCWPLLAVIVWQNFTRRDATSVKSQMLRAVHVIALLILLSAVWVNHSRAAQAVFLAQCFLTLLTLFIWFRSDPALTGAGLRSGLVIGAICVCAVGGMAVAFGFDTTMQKWGRFIQGGLAKDGRWAVARTCAQWFDQIPNLGYGPGTFQAVFVVKTTGMSNAPAGYWQFAHDDYLQTYVEWGWVGTVGWLTLGVGILGVLAKHCWKWSRRRSFDHRLTLAAILVSLVSVTLHATVDFPLQIFAIQLFAAALAGTGLGMISTSREGNMIKNGREQRVNFHSHDNSTRPQAGAP